MKKSTAIVKLGYHSVFAFSSTDAAIEFYRLVSASIPVTSHYGELPNGRKGVRYIRSDGSSLELEQVADSQIELEHTEDELKQQAAAKDDVDGVVELISVTDAPKEIEFTEETDPF